MEILQSLLEFKSDIAEIMQVDQVWIDIFIPDKSFIMPGKLLEGRSKRDKGTRVTVKTTDRLYIRYNWDFQDSIDVEIVNDKRALWFRLSAEQFNSIKYNLRLREAA